MWHIRYRSFMNIRFCMLYITNCSLYFVWLFSVHFPALLLLSIHTGIREYLKIYILVEDLFSTLNDLYFAIFFRCLDSYFHPSLA